MLNAISPIHQFVNDAVYCILDPLGSMLESDFKMSFETWFSRCSGTNGKKFKPLLKGQEYLHTLISLGVTSHPAPNETVMLHGIRATGARD